MPAPPTAPAGVAALFGRAPRPTTCGAERGLVQSRATTAWATACASRVRAAPRRAPRPALLARTHSLPARPHPPAHTRPHTHNPTRPRARLTRADDAAGRELKAMYGATRAKGLGPEVRRQPPARQPAAASQNSRPRPPPPLPPPSLQTPRPPHPHTTLPHHTHTRVRTRTPQVKRRILMGTYARPRVGHHDAYYKRAQQVGRRRVSVCVCVGVCVGGGRAAPQGRLRLCPTPAPSFTRLPPRPPGAHARGLGDGRRAGAVRTRCSAPRRPRPRTAWARSWPTRWRCTRCARPPPPPG